MPKGSAVLALKEGIVSVDHTDTGRILAITSTEIDSRTFILEKGWTPALANGDLVVKDKTVIAVGPNEEKKYSDIDGNFFLDDRTIYVRNEREEREEHQVPVTYQVLSKTASTSPSVSN